MTRREEEVRVDRRVVFRYAAKGEGAKIWVAGGVDGKVTSGFGTADAPGVDGVSTGSVE